MKSKVLLSMLVVALSVALIAGGTGAWFTADATVPTAEFTAGSVLVNVDEGEEFIATPEGKYFDNVNPGDCARVTWDIVNVGTKDAVFRIKLDKAWTDALSADNVYYSPLPNSNWTMYEDMNGLWLYYTGAPVPGTYTPESGEAEPQALAADQYHSVPLTIVLGFDGAATGNEYQGKRFTIGGQLNAVQASNGAPLAVWGDGWTIANSANSFYVNEGLAATYANYFLSGAGSEMPCWPGQGEEVLYDIDTEVGWYDDGEFFEDNTLGTISVVPASPQAKDVLITLTNLANNEDEYDFLRWEIWSGGTMLGTFDPKVGEPVGGTTYTLNYTMPAADILVRAIWDGGSGEPQPITYALTTQAIVPEGGTVTAGGNYEAGASISLTAASEQGFNFTGWTIPTSVTDAVEDGMILTFTMPDEDVEIIANFEEISEPAKYTLKLIQYRKKNSGGFEEGTYGTVTGSGTYEVGENVTLTATDGFGWKFDGWFTTKDAGNGARLSTSYTYTYNNTSAADGETVTIYARFVWPK